MDPVGTVGVGVDSCIPVDVHTAPADSPGHAEGASGPEGAVGAVALVGAVEGPTEIGLGQAQQTQQAQAQGEQTQEGEMVWPQPIDLASYEARARLSLQQRLETARWRFEWEMVSAQSANAAIRKFHP